MSTVKTTQILAAIAAGDARAADQLVPLLYDELHRLAGAVMSRESPGHTLQPTALVNEAFLKLADQDRVEWQGRAHFFAVAARLMRRILVDHARGKGRAKRGGGMKRITLNPELSISPERDEDLLAVDDAIVRLAALNERHANIVELRFFGGLTVKEAAEVLHVSTRTVESDWTMIKAWLRRELTAAGEA
jgi:RNA polymerase sigma-70 factor (ECF subfamily)